jgi:hypothetical protein
MSDADEDYGDGPRSSRLGRALNAHRARFGDEPGVFRLLTLPGWDAAMEAEAAAAIEAAVARGKPLSGEALERRFGLRPLPPGARA